MPPALRLRQQQYRRALPRPAGRWQQGASPTARPDWPCSPLHVSPMWPIASTLAVGAI